MLLLNGKRAAVPMENLSEDDQKWVKARTEPATVPDELRGQGIAAILTRAALDEARRLGRKIIPACSYIETFIKRNPEFTGLLAG